MRAWLACVLIVGCSDGSNTATDAAVGDAGTDVGVGVDASPDAAWSADAGADATLLSMQGVYGNFSLRTIPGDAIAYSVNSELWADGATKRRWLILPQGGATIDNTDQEHWIFPVGTRFVKEFTRNGMLVETRIVERVADVSTVPTYSMRTYVWRADDLDADLDLDGAVDVRGTPHNAPSAGQCTTCHNGEPGKVLGFSAVQLPPSTLAMLSSQGKLSQPIGSGVQFGPTGTAAQTAALGYLHANCGHCHNPNGVAWGVNQMNLRLDAAAKAANQEPAYVTSVSVNVTGNGLGATLRVDPANVTNSAIYVRANVRGTGQMPQIATEEVDATGIGILAAWIAAP